jgi:CubicO group peptidase (beta-lactamase class C family)
MVGEPEVRSYIFRPRLAMADHWTPLRLLLNDGVRQGVYTAAVALVGLHGELQWQAAVGRLSRDPKAAATTLETVFDLASLTKPLATSLALMRLTDDGRLTPDATLGEFLPTAWLPPDKRPLTLAQLLAHRAGLPAWEPFYEKVLQAPSETRTILLPRLAAAVPLIHQPGTVTLYSDLGFMLLQAVVESVSGLPLDRFCEEKIYHPLGLNAHESMNLTPKNENPPYPPFPKGGLKRPPLEKGDLGGFEVFTVKSLGFNPLLLTENRKQKTENRFYAATEPGLIPGRPAAGQVHDENAWAAGGVAGHAGLFGAGPEVFALVAALYRAYQGETGLPFSPATVRHFFTPVAPGARALGFDVSHAKASQCSAGRYFSPASVGHLGFTGTSFWLDLELGQMVVLLTNRVHLGRDDKTKIQAFRPRFHEAASWALGFDKIYRK